MKRFNPGDIVIKTDKDVYPHLTQPSYRVDAVINGNVGTAEIRIENRWYYANHFESLVDSVIIETIRKTINEIFDKVKASRRYELGEELLIGNSVYQLVYWNSLSQNFDNKPYVIRYIHLLQKSSARLSRKSVSTETDSVSENELLSLGAEFGIEAKHLRA